MKDTETELLSRLLGLLLPLYGRVQRYAGDFSHTRELPGFRICVYGIGNKSENPKFYFPFNSR